MFTISLISSGKLSYNLCEVFSNNENFRIIEIYSRRKKNTNLFSEKIKFTDKIEPADYLEKAKSWVDSGAQIIGGCCGIGVEEIKAISVLKN